MTFLRNGLKPSFWQVVAVIFMMTGVYAAYVRVTRGLGGATNLNDQFPWGLWIGFDILCGVGLAAGRIHSGSCSAHLQHRAL